MKNKLLLLTLILFVFGKPCLSQSTNSDKTKDSLLKIVNTENGIAKIDALLELAANEFFGDSEKGLEYANEALDLSKRINYENGKISALISRGYYEKNQLSKESNLKAGFALALKAKDYLNIKMAISIAEIIYGNNHPEKVIVYIEQSIPEIEKLNKRKYLATLYKMNADQYFNKGNSKTAAVYYKKASEEFQKNNDLLQKAGMTMNLGVLYFKIGQLDSSLAYYKEAQRTFEKLNDLKNEASAITNIAITLESQGKQKEALSLMNMAVKKYIQDKDSFLLAGAYESISGIYDNLGDNKKSFDYTLNSYKIREMLKDTIGLIYSHLNLCKVYQTFKNIDRAFENVRKAITLAKKTPNIEYLANTYMFYSKLLAETNIDSALYYEKLSLSINTQIGYTERIATNNNNIGNYYIDNNNYREALSFLITAVNIAEEIGDENHLVKFKSDLGYCYTLINMPQKAIPLFKEAEISMNQSGSLINKELLFYRLSEAYFKTQNFKMAHLYLLKSKDLSDSLNVIENEKNNAELLEKYETDKKQTEISLLKKDQDIKNLQVTQQQENLNKQSRFLFLAGVLILIISVFAVFLFKSNAERKKANKIISDQKLETEKQKELTEQKNAEIIDSIKYAKKIQDTLLINQSFIDEHFPENFIYFKPKDIVSGDFYWGVEWQEHAFIAVCDSTGHGVPGAFMSLLNMSFLNEAVKERCITDPGLIFNYVRERLVNTISKDGAQDGMDGILISLDKSKNKITYSAAHNAPLLIRNNEIINLEADKMPVGKGVRNHSFSTHEIALQKGDMIYLYTDGFADQFGGENGKKFKNKHLKEKLKNISNISTYDQNEELKNCFDNWKGELEQIDDVTIIGMRF